MHCVENKTRLITCLIAGLISLPVFGQEKKQAPTTRFTLPVDTTAADTSTVTPPPAPGDKKIELPEVLIYGKDTSKRISGKKITISPDNTELVNPPVFYDPISVEEMDRGEREKLRKKKQGREKRLRAHAWGGQFSQLGGGFSWWQDAGELDYSIELGFDRTDGQYANSDVNRFKGTIEMGYSGENGNRWSVRGQMNSSEYGLYGSAIPESRRSYGWSGLWATGTTAFSKTGSVEFNAGLLRGTVSDDETMAGLYVFSTAYSLWQLNGQLRQTFEKGELVFTGTVLSDRLQETDSTWQELRWQKWQAAWETTLLRGKVQLHLGAVLTNVTQDTLAESLFGPDIRVIILPGSRLAITLRGSRGLRYAAWDERLRTNPWLAREYRTGSERIAWNGGLDIEWKISRTTALNLRYTLAKIEAYRYYEALPTGFFDLRSADVRFKDLGVLLSRTLAENFTVEAGITFLDDAVNLNGFYDAALDVPYRGEFSVPVKATWSPTERLTLEADYLWIGSRVATLQPAAAIDAWSALNVAVDFRLGEFFSLTAEGRNLLNTTTALWQGYKTTGTHVRGGIRIQW